MTNRMIVVAVMALMVGLIGGGTAGWILAPSVRATNPAIDATPVDAESESPPARRADSGARDEAGPDDRDTTIAELRATIDSLRRQLASPSAGDAPADNAAADEPDRTAIALPTLADAIAAAEARLERKLDDAERERLAALFREFIAGLHQHVEQSTRALSADFATTRRAEIAIEQAITDGDSGALLKAARNGGLADPSSLLADADALDRLTRAKTGGTVHTGVDLANGTEMKDGDVVSLGMGYHDSRDVFRSGFPANLTIKGRGMNLSALQISRHRMQTAGVESLTIRDITLHCGDGDLFDVWPDVDVAIRFHRARIVGFDSGAGGSLLIDARGDGAVLVFATDSSFEDGYGSGGGNLFGGDHVYVSAVNCRFLGPDLGDFGGARARYQNCTFVLAPDSARFGSLMRSELEGQLGEKVELVDPVWEVLSADETDDFGRVQRSLSDIDPAWPERER